MSFKISKIEQNYRALDFKELQNDLNLADVENLGEREYSIAKYKETGERPVKVAAADASSFGLRKAFWDIYAPVENTAGGQWRLDKDAVTGEEFIIRKDSNLNGDTK